ncbi:hypothetical protein J2Y58_001591 [Sphingomonas sp. BE138]|uniref:hypothetical protein n=1 Tax=Sphingomonas sp. BE138 TaxID=2817845 RepID=UPI00285603FD|nr:hypothetical protein [Sphingomonas sp. BE138]MDR6788233.1 hypothetical protein [Sphingomonas sp. BE138]
MRKRCLFGVHHWSSRATARAGTTVHRCARCGRTVVTHGGGGRQLQLRVWAMAALVLTAGVWFVTYNLIVHRRTRVLHTVSRTVNKADRAAARGRAALHRIEGDRGAYVEGNDD